MTLICTKSSLGRKRVVWLVALLLVLAAVSGLGIYVTPKTQSVATLQPQQKVKGVWLNYMEYASLINGFTEEEYTINTKELLDTIQSIGLNTLFLHLRSHSDSLYPSKIFPWSKLINGGAGVDYDPLGIILEQAGERNIAVHAWLNPYRISSGMLSELDANHPAAVLKEKDENSVVETDTGVYYNPANALAQELVLSGVEEILENYKVAGVQYDDYFYPTTLEEFDKASYEAYCNSTDYPLSLSDYRRTQVNLLVAATHRRAKEYGVTFGVSPAANIQKNKEQLYADVAAWVQGGFVDYLCPQLYFGFSYPLEQFRFDTLYEQWKTLAGEIPLYIGLASYKVGEVDNGSCEWVTATDLLARQTAFSKDAQGVCFYHYSSLVNDSSQSQKELEGVKKALAQMQ